MSSKAVVQRDNDVCTTVLGSELIVVSNLEQGNLYRFNAVAVDLWGWLEQPKSTETLSQLLAQKYQGQATDYHSEVIEWVEDAIAKGLVVTNYE